jgi:hypothetical protein
MGCSSSNEELENEIAKLIEKREAIRKLKKRKIKRLEKLTNEKFNKEVVPDCYVEIKKEKPKESMDSSD